MFCNSTNIEKMLDINRYYYIVYLSVCAGVCNQMGIIYGVLDPRSIYLFNYLLNDSNDINMNSYNIPINSYYLY